jgi:ribonuclease HI
MVARRLSGKSWGLKPNMLRWLYNMVVKPVVTYAALVWWPKTQQSTAIKRLGKLQRLACLGITGAMKTTPTAAMEVLLGLPPLHYVIQGEARLGIYRLQNTLNNVNVGSGHTSIVNLVKGAVLNNKTDHTIKKYSFNIPFEVLVPDRDVWNERRISDFTQGQTWYTDGSKTATGTGAGVYSRTFSASLSYALGKDTSVFQAEVYAILQCAREINRRAIENQLIHILSDSQAALGAISSQEVTSKLVWECLEELRTLADRNRVKLIWVPGHQGIEGNEKADELAKRGSEIELPRPDAHLGVCKSTVRRYVKDWIWRKHGNYWANLPRQMHSKAFIGTLCQKKTEELFLMNRNQLRIITGFLTGHAPVKNHLHKIGLYNGDLNCRLCNKEPETVKHILCYCEALDRKRQTIFGQPQGEPELYRESSVKDLYTLVQGTKILEWV